MRLPDDHVHTCYSPDSVMQPYEAVEAALAAGMTDLCFTEHMDLGHHMESFNRIPDFSQIRDGVARLRARYPQINIRFGLEAGYMPETSRQTAQAIARERLDYVLLSTHCVDGIDCYLPESKRGRDKTTAYRRYLETLYESVMDDHLLDHYDCIGHIGYIAKCRHYEDNALPYQLFPELFDRILAEIIRRGKGIEVNTSGINRAGHVLPHPSILSRYRELGGRVVTLGSDAHKPEHVGNYGAEALGIIKSCGFREIALFSRRTPAFIRID